MNGREEGEGEKGKGPWRQDIHSSFSSSDSVASQKVLPVFYFFVRKTTTPPTTATYPLYYYYYHTPNNKNLVYSVQSNIFFHKNSPLCTHEGEEPPVVECPGV